MRAGQSQSNLIKSIQTKLTNQAQKTQSSRVKPNQAFGGGWVSRQTTEDPSRPANPDPAQTWSSQVKPGTRLIDRDGPHRQTPAR